MLLFLFYNWHIPAGYRVNIEIAECYITVKIMIILYSHLCLNVPRNCVYMLSCWRLNIVNP